MITTCIVGFDSAWTDSAKAPGAICSVIISEDGSRIFDAPMLATFHDAVLYIAAKRSQCDRCLVCIDQPTIVPNETHSRPADRIAASVISFVGGGVQPANRSRAEMFGSDAPIWRFKTKLQAVDDPVAFINSNTGLYLAEVFPALALLTFGPQFMQRKKAPKYNPANRAKFKLSDWESVCEVAKLTSLQHHLPTAADWCETYGAKARPTKADQDKLDALLCALIGLHWLCSAEKIMIGDLISGFIISPSSAAVTEKLMLAAGRIGVPIVYSS